MKYQKPKEKNENRAIMLSSVIATLILLVVALTVTLVVCVNIYHWKAEDILYWLNPFSEGNNITFAVYFVLVLLVMLLIWAIHEKRQHRQ